MLTYIEFLIHLTVFLFNYVSGNTNKSNKSKTVFSSSVIGPHGK